jgi:hypothetical protein
MDVASIPKKCRHCGGKLSDTHRRPRCLECHRAQPGFMQRAPDSPKYAQAFHENLQKGEKKGAW